ncbi:acyl-coenzyme A thioesterase 1-like [Nelusetta ayraudi]|uniref:acyl-coenzyme A thioesterase 1-like n=1 Tax=Nelusetta ayraudi TaxID=303726 RepID=UPI003F6F7CAF
MSVIGRKKLPAPELLSVLSVCPCRPSSTVCRPPVLSVSPRRALVDEKLTVLVENLRPGLPVTLRSLHLSEDEHYWEAYGHYISNHRGAVSVADDLSFGGTYTGKEAMGLVWGMRPVPGSHDALRFTKRNVCSPLLVNFSVYSSHHVGDFRELAPLASTLVERWYIAPGVQRIDVREKGVRATLFIPPGPGPFPALLDLWGLGGGLLEYRASLLASHGYAVMALHYIDSSRVTSADTEMETFETAFSFLKDHPQVISDKVGMFGFSSGSVVTIFLMAESAVVKASNMSCSIRIICVQSVKVKFTLIKKGWGGEHCDGSNVDKIRVNEDGQQTWAEGTRALLDDPSCLVDVGKINFPLLLVNGCDDQNVVSTEYAKDMSQRMTAAGKKHLLTVLNYPGAGHLIEPPFSPHCRVARLNKKITLVHGGKTKPHSDAQEDAWLKILAYLRHHLYSTP